MGTGIFGTDGTDPEEDSGVLDARDTLEDLDGVEDVLDRGWSPAERPWGVVGDRRAGRLVEDDGRWDDDEPELHASDTGIDAGAASAEEAAVHVVPERDADRFTTWGTRPEPGRHGAPPPGPGRRRARRGARSVRPGRRRTW
jgi:hypothetical protein